MRTYHYRGYTATGTLRQGHVEAEGRKPALRQLSVSGIFVERLEPVRFRSGLPVARRSALYRELGALLAAGLPLERALGVLMEAGVEGDGRYAEALAPIRDAVRDGRPMADAMASADPRMDAYEHSVLAAAERTATLPGMLQTLADFLEGRTAVTERLRSAAIYPCFVLALGVGVAFLMLGVLVPRTQIALAAAGVALPAASRIVVGVARGVAWATGMIAGGGVLGGLWLSGLCRRDPTWRRRRDRWRLTLPGIGRVMGSLAASRFAATLSVLTRSGVPVVDGLSLAGAATGNQWLKDWVEKEAEGVRHGRRLSEAVGAVTPLASRIAEWVRVGEAGGCLAAMLDVAASRSHTEWERSMTRWLALFEPLVLALVGLFVLAVALAVLLPVMALTRAIG